MALSSVQKKTVTKRIAEWFFSLNGKLTLLFSSYVNNSINANWFHHLFS